MRVSPKQASRSLRPQQHMFCTGTLDKVKEIRRFDPYQRLLIQRKHNESTSAMKDNESESTRKEGGDNVLSPSMCDIQSGNVVADFEDAHVGNS
jgi:hypothetical protein